MERRQRASCPLWQLCSASIPLTDCIVSICLFPARLSCSNDSTCREHSPAHALCVGLNCMGHFDFADLANHGSKVCNDDDECRESISDDHVCVHFACVDGELATSVKGGGAWAWAWAGGGGGGGLEGEVGEGNECVDFVKGLRGRRVKCVGNCVLFTLYPTRHSLQPGYKPST